MHRFANPSRFMRMSAAALPWLVALTAALLVVGLFLALVAAPPDYQQGDSARIMFIHVPAAWTALFAYVLIVLASASSLIWRHPLADIAGREAAPIGASFTLICLVTGSLWGKPMWGTWWVWDARLTSVLILFFLYLGYLALANAFDEPTRGARAAAILALVGAINLPVIKFSVDWWNTLHQPASVFRLGGPSIHLSLLAPLGVMATAFTSFFIAVWLVRIRAAIIARKVAMLIQIEGPRLGETIERRATPGALGVTAASAQ
jgi:heme exporter protein C